MIKKIAINIGILLICIINIQSIAGCKQVSTKMNKDKSIYVVDSLDIPDCEYCDSIGMKLNKMFSTEINVGDKFIFNDDFLYILNNSGDTIMKNKFVFENNSLNIYGSDWIDVAAIVKKTKDSIILKKKLNIAFGKGEIPPSSDFIIYLSRVTNK